MPERTWPLERLWFYGTLCYCVAVCGVAWVLHAPRGPMPPLIRVLFAPAMLCYARMPFTRVRSLVSGDLRLPETSVRPRFG